MAESSLDRLHPLAKALVGLMLIVLIAVAYLVVFYLDVSQKTKSARRQEQQLRQDLSDAQKSKAAYQRDVDELTKRQQRQGELAKILPSTTESPAFLAALQSVANVAGVDLSAWSPQEEVPEQFYARIPMKLEMRGRYHQVARFFHGVGQLDRIINIENISISDPEVRDEDVFLEIEALATAFRLLDPKVAAQNDKRKKKKGTRK